MKAWLVIEEVGTLNDYELFELLRELSFKDAELSKSFSRSYRRFCILKSRLLVARASSVRPRSASFLELLRTGGISALVIFLIPFGICWTTFDAFCEAFLNDFCNTVENSVVLT